MSTNVDANLRQAVESFSWDDPEINDGLPIPENDFKVIVTQIFKDIHAVAGIIPELQESSEEELSLTETCYQIIQEEQREASILNYIKQASPSSKNVLNLAFKILSKQFNKTPSNELQSTILLLGIELITERVSKTIEFPDVIQKK